MTVKSNSCICPNMCLSVGDWYKMDIIQYSNNNCPKIAQIYVFPHEQERLWTLPFLQLFWLWKSERILQYYVHHVHNISTNLFHQGSTSPHAVLQLLSRAAAVFPQTLALMDSRLFQVKFCTSRTPSSQRQHRFSSQLDTSSLFFWKRTPTWAWVFH